MIFSLQNENSVGLDLFWITVLKDSIVQQLSNYMWNSTTDTVLYSLYDVLAAIFTPRWWNSTTELSDSVLWQLGPGGLPRHGRRRRPRKVDQQWQELRDLENNLCSDIAHLEERYVQWTTIFRENRNSLLLLFRKCLAINVFVIQGLNNYRNQLKGDGGTCRVVRKHYNQKNAAYSSSISQLGVGYPPLKVLSSEMDPAEIRLIR